MNINEIQNEITESTKRIYFVDGENSITATVDSRIDGHIMLFLGHKQTISKAKYKANEIIKASAIGPNSLDFQMSAYIGALHMQLNKDIEFVVITADKGFEALVKWIKIQNRNCKLIDTKSPSWNCIKFFNELLINGIPETKNNFCTAYHDKYKNNEGSKCLKSLIYLNYLYMDRDENIYQTYLN